MARSKIELVSEIVSISGSLDYGECVLCHAKNIRQRLTIGGQFSIHIDCLKICRAIAELDNNY